MTTARRSLFAVIVVSALCLAVPESSYAACAGDCGGDLQTVPKTGEKYVKARWKGALKCGKKADPPAPTPCPLPDGAADPSLLSASCSALIACNLDALAETAYDTTW